MSSQRSNTSGNCDQFWDVVIGNGDHELSIRVGRVGRYRGVQPRSKVSMIVIRPPQQGARGRAQYRFLVPSESSQSSVDRCRPINLTAEARQYPSFPLGLGSERFKGTFLVAIMVEKTVRGRW